MSTSMEIITMFLLEKLGSSPTLVEVCTVLYAISDLPSPTDSRNPLHVSGFKTITPKGIH